MSKMMTAAQVAEHLRCSISTVRHLTSARAIPFYKFGPSRGSKVVYDLAELEIWLRKYRVAPIAERAKNLGAGSE